MMNPARVSIARNEEDLVRNKTFVAQTLNYLVFLLAMGTLFTNVARAQSVEDLRWFDAENGTLRSPDTASNAPPTPSLSDPKSPNDWTWEPPNFSNNRSWNFSGFSDGVAQILKILSWALLAGLALWFVLFALRSYRDLELGKKPASDQREFEREVDIEKLADLPFDSPAARGDLLTLIRQKYEQGNYGDAIVLLFGYQLLRLDKTQWIRILKGKTNRQYIRELAGRSDQPRLREMLSQTMVAFEDYFFGDHPLTRDRFEACYRQLDDFHAIVEASA